MIVVVKRFAVLSVLTLTLFNTSLCAAGTQGYAFGKIEYVAETERSENEHSSSKTNSFLQKYLLGYTGSVYSPKLFKYYAETAYDIDKVKRDNIGVTSSDSVKSVNYKLRADIINGTKYPFSVYYENYNTPYWSTNPGGASYTNQEIDRYGIRGSMGLKIFDLSYSAGETDITSSRDFDETKQISSDYMVSLRRSFKNVNAGISHNYRDSDMEQKDLDGTVISTDNDITKTTVANVDWLPSRILKVNTYASHREYSTRGNTIAGGSYETNELTGSSRVSWNPTKKYWANIMASVNRQETNGNDTDTATMSANSRYQILNELSTSQDIMYFQSERVGASDELTSIGADIRYAKTYPLENNYNFRLNSGLRGVTNSSNSTPNESNTTTYEDDFEIVYDLGAGISKYFDSSATNYSFDANYYISYSDRYGDTSRYLLSSVLSTRFNPKSSFKNRLRYVKETRNGKSVINDYDRDTYEMHNTLDYSTRVRLKGTLRASANLSYVGGSDSDGRLYGGGNVNFNYTLMRNMQFKSAGTFRMDYDNDITTYTASAGVDYKIRKIMLSFLAKQAKQTGGNVDSSRTSAYLKASRKF